MFFVSFNLRNHQTRKGPPLYDKETSQHPPRQKNNAAIPDFRLTVWQIESELLHHLDEE
jgi:hypothetical protein